MREGIRDTKKKKRREKLCFRNTRLQKFGKLEKN